MPLCRLFFFFNDTATTEIYTLSLHDALPISARRRVAAPRDSHGGRRKSVAGTRHSGCRFAGGIDRKSTRLNSSHQIISYAVFCLKKKKRYDTTATIRLAAWSSYDARPDRVRK